MKKFLLIILLTITQLITLLLTACGNKDNRNHTTEHAITSAESSEASEDADATTYRLSIPKDFSEIKIDGMEFYYAAEDGSSVSLNLQPMDTAFSQVSAKELNAALSDALLQTYEEEVVIADHYFTINPISGYPAYQYAISYKLQGDEVTQIMIGIDADQTYTFTYTDLAGTWLDIFEDSIKTITFINE